MFSRYPSTRTIYFYCDIHQSMQLGITAVLVKGRSIRVDGKRIRRQILIKAYNAYLNRIGLPESNQIIDGLSHPHQSAIHIAI